ncbi:MAG: aminotransferase class I/II-fold pyridoxal phosphate-dependent enzyme [Thermoplasmatota archaeon]
MVLEASPRSLGVEYAIRDVVIPARALEKQGHEVLKLNIGDPIPYGFQPPQHMIEAMADAARAGFNGYSASEGDPELVDAIINRERRRNNASYAPEDILVGTGVSEVLQMLLGSAVLPGEEVLIPGPTYPPYESLVKYFGGTPVGYRTVEEEDWQPDIDDLRKKITPKTKAVSLINPNNPTGALYSEKIVKELADLVGEHQDQMFLISDEIYDDMTFDGQQVASVSVAPDVPMVTLNGMSKVYLAPGWRLGHAMFNNPTGSLDQIKEGCLKVARNRICASSIAQKAAAVALNGSQEHIAAMNEALRPRRDLAVKRLNEIEGLSSAKPDGAYYAFPKLDFMAEGKGPWKTDKEFVLDFLQEEKVLTVHGSGFDKTYGKDHFRIVILPEMNILETAFDRLESFLQRKLP